MARSRLPRSTPEAEGIDSGAILDLVDALVAVPELHSIMVLRHGRVAAEGWAHPFTPERRRNVFSVSKSFTSSAVGFAIAEGLLSLDDRVLDLLPEDAPPDPPPHLAQLRVRHLLTMTLGHEVSPEHVFHGRDWARTTLALPVPLEPGSRFVYNSSATYLLSAILHRLTGQRLLTYLRPRLLRPLGITGARWQRSPEGIDAGCFGLMITTEDIAVLGQLYLQRGVWRGRQVLPEGWADEATRAQVSNSHITWGTDFAQGYGYQFWRCQHNAYRADGAFGQMAVVLPERDVVVAVTGATEDLQSRFTAIWDHLLPGLHDGPLPSAPRALAALTEKLASLALPPPEGTAVTATARRISGRTIEFPEQPHGFRWAVLDAGDQADQITLRTARRTIRLRADHAEPVEQRVRLPWLPGPAQPVLVSGTWTDPSRYVLTYRSLEAPSVATVEMDVTGDEVTISGRLNVAFGPKTASPLRGVIRP